MAVATFPPKKIVPRDGFHDNKHLDLLSPWFLIKCHLLQLSPRDPFMLMANGVQELALTVQPASSEGKKMMFVNVVGERLLFWSS